MALGNWILALGQRELQLSGSGGQDISHGTEADAVFFCGDGSQRHRGRRTDNIPLTCTVVAQVQQLSGHSSKLVRVLKNEERDQRKPLPVWGICIVN